MQALANCSSRVGGLNTFTTHHSRAPARVKLCRRLSIARVGSLQRPLVEQQDLQSDISADSLVVEHPVSQAYDKGYQAGYQAALKEAGLVAPTRTQDSLLRTTLKSFTWRIASGLTTMALAYVIFKDTIQADDALALGVGEFISKFALFFAHERAWALVSLL